jgi:hypothetical protein
MSWQHTLPGWHSEMVTEQVGVIVMEESNEAN